MRTNERWLFYFVIFHLATDGSTLLTDYYYWSDYNGEIPSDAVKGGYNSAGEITYIGQASGGDNTVYGNIPTEINVGDSILNIPLRGGLTSKSEMKILCSLEPSDFQWVNTTAQTFLDDIWNKRLVKGGTQISVEKDNRMLLFVGRVWYNDRIVVGKIVTNSTNYPLGYSPFYMSIDAARKSSAQEEFQVLVYGLARVSDYYYWKDYNGKVPRNAVAGGINSAGEVTYIGQALGGNKIAYGNIPTEINVGDRILKIPLRGGLTSKSDMKILCSSSPSYFQWVNTTAQNFLDDMWNTQLVKGGTQTFIDNDNRMILFVGRIHYNNRIVIGKIETNSTSYSPGYSPFFMSIDAANESPLQEEFQVLVNTYYL